MSRILALSLFLFSFQVAAIEELKVCTGDATRMNIFIPMEAQMEKEIGLKIVYPLPSDASGAAVSLRAMLEGKCEAAASAGDFKSWMEIAQKEKISVDPNSITSRVIGRDFIKFMVHPKNATPQLSMKSLVLLLSGKVKNWKELGGPDAPVKLYLASKKPATTKNVQSIVLKTENYSSASVNLETWVEAIAEVQKNLGGIVFMSGNADSKDLKMLQLQEPVGRPLTMITKGRPSKTILKLYDFIEKRGSDIAKK